MAENVLVPLLMECEEFPARISQPETDRGRFSQDGEIHSYKGYDSVSVVSTTLRGVRKRSDDDAYGNRHRRGSPCTGDALRSAPVAPHTCSDAGIRAGVYRILYAVV
ncbi:hypothetical protein CBL_08913 [Carabus blaptoides fortunei]